MLSACGGPDLETRRDAAVWISADGEEWARLRHAALSGVGEQQMTAAALSSTDLVVVGNESVEGDRNAAVWRSDDGVVWRRVRDDDLAGPGEQWLWDVAHTQLGWVAVGSSGNPRNLDGAVWISIDGTDWERVALLGGAGEQVVNAVVEFEGAVYVAGKNNVDAAVWVSRDLYDWESMGSDDLQASQLAAIDDLNTNGSVLIASGIADTDAAVWSLDGSEWVRQSGLDDLGDYGRQRASAIAIVEDRTVLLGSDFQYDEIFLGGGYVGTQDLAGWTAEVDGSWDLIDEVAFGGIGEQAVVSLSSWSGGLIASGWDLAGRGSVEEGIAGTGSQLDVDAAIWMSDDGLSWVRVDSPEFGGDDWQDIWDVVELPDTGLVAVGGDDLGSPPD